MTGPATRTGRPSLPHAYPFVLVDRVLEREGGKSILCEKLITADDALLRAGGRAPHEFPRLLLVEAMAQASGLLVADKGGQKAYLSCIKNMVFKKAVYPGDRLLIRSALIHSLSGMHMLEASVEAAGEAVAGGELCLSTL